MNEVYETETFSHVVASCDKTEQDWIEKMRDQLKENLHVGKPLRFEWFREKRFGGKRLYYIINEKTRKAILLAFGNKKEQQLIIDQIMDNMESFKKMIA